MATTNKKINFSYFERKQDFTAALQAELANNIVFVEDTKEVFTHGEFFGIRSVTLNYDSSTTRLQLKDGDVVVSEMDATAFVKDGMLDSVSLVKTQESGVSEAVPYLKFVFNTDAGKSAVRLSVSDLVDSYDGSSIVLTQAFAPASSYSAPAAGDSVDVAVSKLLKGHSDNTTALSGKQATITGAATTVTLNDLTADRALISSGSGKIAVSSTTATELGYVHGVTSGIQAQIDGKQATLTFDSTPTVNSNNPVKSGGLYNELRIQSTDVLIDVDWTTLQIVNDDSDYRILPGSFAGKYVRIVNLPISNMQILYMLQSEWLSTPSKVVYICSADKAIGIRGFYESAFNIAVFPDSLHKYTINTPFTENGVDYICPLEAESFTPTTTSLKEFVKLLDSRISSEEIVISGKQDALTFDDAPTVGSNNVVKSGGVKVAIDSAPRFYIGTCSTAGNVAIKQVDITGFPTTLVNGVETPIVGSVIAVKFAYNDAVTAEQKKIKVNNTNAYGVWASAVEQTATAANSTVFGTAGRYTYYVFDGTYWAWVSQGVDANSTYTAGTGLKLSSNQFSLNVPVVTKSANSLPGLNSAMIENYVCGVGYNLPTSDSYYNIVTIQGGNSVFATQIAFASTTGTAAFTRSYVNGVWQPWLRLDNPTMDSTPTAGNTSNVVSSAGIKNYVDTQVSTKSNVVIRQWVTA